MGWLNTVKVNILHFIVDMNKSWIRCLQYKNPVDGKKFNLSLQFKIDHRSGSYSMEILLISQIAINICNQNQVSRFLSGACSSYVQGMLPFSWSRVSNGGVTCADSERRSHHIGQEAYGGLLFLPLLSSHRSPYIQ